MKKNTSEKGFILKQEEELEISTDMIEQLKRIEINKRIKQEAAEKLEKYLRAVYKEDPQIIQRLYEKGILTETEVKIANGTCIVYTF